MDIGDQGQISFQIMHILENIKNEVFVFLKPLISFFCHVFNFATQICHFYFNSSCEFILAISLRQNSQDPITTGKLKYHSRDNPRTLSSRDQADCSARSHRTPTTQSHCSKTGSNSNSTHRNNNKETLKMGDKETTPK